MFDVSGRGGVSGGERRGLRMLRGVEWRLKGR